MTTRHKVLFLCTGNSCRSQMAEGWARHLHGDQIEAYSAGIVAKGLNALAVAAMREAGVDITEQTSKTVAELRSIPFACVVTVCGNAHDTCPAWITREQVWHVGFDDPPELALSAASEAEALPHYRRVRDEIRAFITLLPEALAERVAR